MSSLSSGIEVAHKISRRIALSRSGQTEIRLQVRAGLPPQGRGTGTYRTLNPGFS